MVVILVRVISLLAFARVALARRRRVLSLRGRLWLRVVGIRSDETDSGAVPIDEVADAVARDAPEVGAGEPVLVNAVKPAQFGRLEAPLTVLHQTVVLVHQVSLPSLQGGGRGTYGALSTFLPQLRVHTVLLDLVQVQQVRRGERAPAPALATQELVCEPVVLLVRGEGAELKPSPVRWERAYCKWPSVCQQVREVYIGWSTDAYLSAAASGESAVRLLIASLRYGGVCEQE